MNQEQLSKLNVKPKFNLKFNKEDTRYSDGDVEDTIIDILEKCAEEDYGEAVVSNFSWPVYYHLTPLRKNILNWYPFEKDKDILEIGCGLGSITNMLCDKAKSVTSVELSKRRATGTLVRCRKKENLEIIVGNLNDIEFEKKFDYITLIGVLEYQGTYTESENPFVDFLAKIKGLLKEGGKLLIAIENKYGLKYWCGAREDHTGVLFDSINQYKIGNKTAITFSKQELSNIANAAGFSYQHFYYPYPDYKMPNVVFSENEEFSIEKLANVAPYYIPDSKTLIANEKDMYQDLIMNKEMPFFANSFLLECSMDDVELGKIIYALMNNSRKKDMNVGTAFTSDGKVIKWNNQTNDLKHIEDTLNNLAIIEKHGLKIIPGKLVEGKLISEKINANTFEEYIVDAYLRKDADDIVSYYDEIMENLNASADEVDAKNNVFLKLDFGKELNLLASQTDFGKIAKAGMYDMIPRNAFVIDGLLHWFDQEWTLENVPVMFLFYHAVCETYFTHPWMENILNSKDVFEHYKISNLVPYFERFMGYVREKFVDENMVEANKVYRCFDSKCITNNIKALSEGAAMRSDDISGIVRVVDKFLEKRKYEELAKALVNVDENSIDSFEMKLFIRWIKSHKNELIGGKDTAITGCNNFYDAIDRISKSI